MRLKYILILTALLVLFGFPNISGSIRAGSGLKDWLVSETAGLEANKDAKLVSENGLVLNCSFQSKKSAVRNIGSDTVAVSISANWICR